jgi:DNA-binding MarR family transcriptional regulator
MEIISYGIDTNGQRAGYGTAPHVAEPCDQGLTARPGRLDLKDTDLECLDLITRYGPLSPSALARRAGLHPATMTGILDRLDRGGWIDRSRDPSDRRGVVVQAARGRGAEILRLYLVDSGMNTAMDQICADYEDKDLELLVGFLRRTADAAQTAAEKLTRSTERSADAGATGLP